MRARERFEQWCEWTGLSQEDLGVLLGVHQTTVSRVRRGTREIGVALAVAVEKRMRSWRRRDGAAWKPKPVTPEDWAADMQREAG